MRRRRGGGGDGGHGDAAALADATEKNEALERALAEGVSGRDAAVAELAAVTEKAETETARLTGAALEAELQVEASRVKVTALEEENREIKKKLERASRTMATQKETAARGVSVVATLARDAKKSREKIARAKTDRYLAHTRVVFARAARHRAQKAAREAHRTNTSLKQLLALSAEAREKEKADRVLEAARWRASASASGRWPEDGGRR